MFKKLLSNFLTPQPIVDKWLDLYNAAEDELLYGSSLPQAKYLIEETIHYAKNLGHNNNRLARTFLLFARYQHLAKDYDNAEITFNKTLDMFEDSMDPNGPDILAWAETHCELGNFYRSRKQAHRADYCYDRARQLYEDNLTHDPFTFGKAMNHLGKYYQELNNFSKARLIFQRGLNAQKGKEASTRVLKAELYQSLGWIHHLMGNTDVTEAHLKKAIHLYEKAMGHSSPEALKTLGDHYLATHRYIEAEECYTFALNITEKADGRYNHAMPDLTRQMADYYIKVEKFEEAESYLKRTLEILTLRPGVSTVSYSNVKEQLGQLQAVLYEHNPASPSVMTKPVTTQDKALKQAEKSAELSE